MKALIVVDVQNDFLPDGALPVPDGDEVISVINGIMPLFPLVIATQDWHPPGHQSFASSHKGQKPGDVISLHGLEQVLWPDHCVQGTRGASFASDLDLTGLDHIVRKGLDPSIDSYSGFFDNGHRKATGLERYLRDRDVDHVVVCGLATDYCVKFTALDALSLGFGVTLVRDATRGVDLNPGDVEKALVDISKAGGTITTSVAL